MNIINVLQRLFYYVKRDKRFVYYEWFCNNLKLNRTEIIESQNELIKRIVIYAYNNTEYYRDLLDRNRINPYDIDNNEKLKEIPVLSKDDIANNLDKIKSNDSYSNDLIKITSGGSTGNQSIIYKSKYFIEKSYAANMRNNLIANWFPSDKVLFIWGAPYENKNFNKSLLLKISFFVNRRYILNAYNYNEKSFHNWITYIKKKKIKIIYGYATILKEFAEFVVMHNVEIQGIKSVISTSEKLENRELISQAFNCPVYDQYGCREILAIGIEDSQGNMIIADDNVVLNINDRGALIVTALHSYGFPLINYEVGDIGETLDLSNNDTDSLPFSKMKLKIGRETENFLSKDGHTVSSSSLSTALSMHDIRIREQQIIQKAYSNFHIKYIAKESFNYNKYRNVVFSVFKKYFGEKIDIKFEEVDQIEKEKSGKKLMFKRNF